MLLAATAPALYGLNMAAIPFLLAAGALEDSEARASAEARLGGSEPVSSSARSPFCARMMP